MEIPGPTVVALVLMAALGYRLSLMHAARAPMDRESARLLREVARFEQSIRGAAEQAMTG